MAMSNDARVESLMRELAELRKSHAAQLREIAAAAGLREAYAVSLIESNMSARKVSHDSAEPEPHGGPGASPSSTDGDFKGSAAPPKGADDPPQPAGKLDRWLNRAKVNTESAGPQKQDREQQQARSVESSPKEEGGGKLGRWLARRQQADTETLKSQGLGVSGQEAIAASSPETPTATQGDGKLGRWLARASTTKPVSCPAAPSTFQAWGQASAPVAEDKRSSAEEEVDEGEELMGRIKESFRAVDSALSLLANRPAETKAPDNQTVCSRCGNDASTPPRGANGSSSPQEQQQPRGMGMRVEETYKGLCVTHIVPGGQGEKGGLQVLDLIKTVDGRPVWKLKELGERVRACTSEIAFEISRGKGKDKITKKLYVTLGGGESSPVDGANRDAVESEKDEGNGMLLGADALLQTFLAARREDKASEAAHSSGANSGHSPEWTEGKGASRAGAGRAGVRPGQKFNKYGKDTQLWVPASDDAGAGALEMPGGDASKFPKQAEAGGFFMFPPGHPDYVPLPPGEAALIAGRSDVHPQERLAPHWSHIIFQAPSGAEIRAQARHATYGSIEQLSGKLVPADPITAHTNLSNASSVAGNIAYVKRGGAPFTKKARVAVAAGAIACVVANTDRETFGMSYTDDGLPFDALNIPCVMISSDIASKLDVSEDWSITLVPARPDQQGTKKPPQGQPNLPAAFAKHEASEGVGMCSNQNKEGEKKLIHPLKGLEGLPINKPGVNIGRPGKKPTMWKKIKLLLP